jgi:hypothetical protein
MKFGKIETSWRRRLTLVAMIVVERDRTTP